MTKVFIDGSSGTTGLRIADRLKNRADIRLLTLDDEKRKKTEYKREMINNSDITVLCLPDEAAKESVALCENDAVKIIDASTAHRTAEGWTYGFPELFPGSREKIKASRRTAVPGCHASGFCAVVFPLIKGGLIKAQFDFVCHSVTGYSGGGKEKIAEYENGDKNPLLASPAQYALGGEHKHLNEMLFICGLEKKPLFNPIIADFYSGMTVSVPFYASRLEKKLTVNEIFDYYNGYYNNEKRRKPVKNTSGLLYAGELAGKDYMEIYVNGNDERITVSASFCNLGKGASGAALQCLNLMSGADEYDGLII